MLQGPHAPLPLTLPLSPRREERRGERVRAPSRAVQRGAVGWAKSPATAHSLVRKCRPAILPTWSGPRGFPRGQNRQRFGAPAGPTRRFCPPYGPLSQPQMRERKQPAGRSVRPSRLRSRSRSGAPPLRDALAGNAFPVKVHRHGRHHATPPPTPVGKRALRARLHQLAGFGEPKPLGSLGRRSKGRHYKGGVLKRLGGWRR